MRFTCLKNSSVPFLLINVNFLYSMEQELILIVGNLTSNKMITENSFIAKYVTKDITIMDTNVLTVKLELAVFVKKSRIP